MREQANGRRSLARSMGACREIGTLQGSLHLDCANQQARFGWSLWIRSVFAARFGAQFSSLQIRAAGPLITRFGSPPIDPRRND